jgi:RNA polymerase sigma factor (sigma-70 family)
MVNTTSEEHNMAHIDDSRRALPGGATAKLRPEGVATLVRSAATGDRSAWNQLVEQFSGLVWAVARSHRLSTADAADVAQTTWLRLVEHVEDLQDPGRVGAWLATTARRECLRILRTSGRQVPYGDELPEPRSEAPEPDEELFRSERDATLRWAFGRLRPDDQALLRMLMVDPGPSYGEISEALDMPIGSIGPTRGRCLQRLRRELELLEAGSRSPV